MPITRRPRPPSAIAPAVGQLADGLDEQVGGRHRRRAGPPGRSARSRAPRRAAPTSGCGSPAARPRAAATARWSWKRTWRSVRPVARSSFVSGTITIVRPSSRPRVTNTWRSTATVCLVPRSTPGPLGARRDVERDAAPVDDGDGHLAVLGIAVDLVADPAGDLGDGRVEVGERAQRLVAEAVAGRAGRQHRLHERRLQQRLVAAGDADGDGLGLVLDGVDGAGELLDALGERGGEVVDHDGRRADPAVLDLVGVERRDAEGVAERRRQAHGGARLEVAVVRAAAQPVEEPRGRGGRGPGRSERSRPSPSVTASSPTASSMAARASRSGRACASMASAAS